MKTSFLNKRAAIIISIVLLATSALHTVGAQDIFTKSSSAKPNTDPYPTSAAFMAATKTGEIPVLMLNIEPVKQSYIGRSVITILHNEYKVDTTGLRNDTDTSCATLLSNITKYEMEGHKEVVAQIFQSNRKSLANECSKSFIESFDLFAKRYATWVRESITLKKDQEDQVKIAEAKRVRDEAAKEKRADDERQQKKAIADAKLASQQAADEIQATATKEALDAQAKARELKLKETLESNAYKLWEQGSFLLMGMAWRTATATMETVIPPLATAMGTEVLASLKSRSI